jgi:glycosyltransferase involved in cell wall biosynthesis
LDRIGPAGLWSRQFDLSAPEVSAVLLRAHVGIVPSVPSAISKSGTYAAFVVHGIRPVIPAIGECDPEGMFPYITNDESNPEACRQALTDAALMGRLGERLRAAAEGPLSWEHIAGRVCQIALGKARQ